MTRLSHTEIRDASRVTHARVETGRKRSSAAALHATVLTELVGTIESDETVQLSLGQRTFMQGELARIANTNTGKATLNISRAVVMVRRDAKNYHVEINWSGRGEPEGKGTAPALEAAFSQALLQSVEAKIDARAAKRDVIAGRQRAEQEQIALLTPSVSDAIAVIDPASPVIVQNWLAGVSPACLTVAVPEEPGPRLGTFVPGAPQV